LSRKIAFLFLFGIELFIAAPLRASDSLSNRIQLLVNKIQTSHVLPRIIDAPFGNQVNDYFISFIDQDERIFKAEDIAYLKELSSNIAEDFKNKKQFYFTETQRILFKNIQEIEEICSVHLSKPIRLNSKITWYNLPKNELTENNFQSQWGNVFTAEVFNEITNLHPDSQKTILRDSLNSFETKARTKVQRSV